MPSNGKGALVGPCAALLLLWGGTHCGYAPGPQISVKQFRFLLEGRDPKPGERLAVLWRNGDPPGFVVGPTWDMPNPRQMAGAPPLAPFELNVVGLPEAFAQQQTSSSSTFQLGIGTLVAYQPGGEGGAGLAFATGADEASAGMIVGAADQVSIVFSNARLGLNQPNIQDLPSGYNLVANGAWVSPQFTHLETTGVYGPVLNTWLLPSDAVLPVVLNDHPVLAPSVCTGSLSTGRSLPCMGLDGGCTPSQIPDGGEVTCSLDRRCFEVKLCPAAESLCGAAACQFGGQCMGAGQVPAPNWPCP